MSSTSCPYINKKLSEGQPGVVEVYNFVARGSYSVGEKRDVYISVYVYILAGVRSCVIKRQSWSVDFAADLAICFW